MAVWLLFRHTTHFELTIWKQTAYHNIVDKIHTYWLAVRQMDGHNQKVDSTLCVHERITDAKKTYYLPINILLTHPQVCQIFSSGHSHPYIHLYLWKQTTLWWRIHSLTLQNISLLPKIQLFGSYRLLLLYITCYVTLAAYKLTRKENHLKSRDVGMARHKKEGGI